MLILERRRGQRIVIGEDVFVSIWDVAGGRVCLGIEAPATVRVDREEVRRAKDAAAGRGRAGAVPVGREADAGRA
jgi:carbon storage regulator